MPSDRPTLSASVDEDTLDTWHDFCAAHGVTISALVEAIGRQLDPRVRPPRFLAEAIKAARRIQAERRDRRPLD